MKIKFLVIGKKQFMSDGKQYHVLKLLLQECASAPYMQGIVLQKFVDKSTYDSFNVDLIKSCEKEIGLELSDNPNYGDVHLKINIL